MHGIPFDPKDQSEAIVPITGLKSSYAADFFYEDREIFVVDSILDKVFRTKTDGSEFKAIIETGLDNAQGIAVDWAAKNLFIADAGRNLIEVNFTSTNGASGVLNSTNID